MIEGPKKRAILRMTLEITNAFLIFKTNLHFYVSINSGSFEFLEKLSEAKLLIHHVARIQFTWPLLVFIT